MSLSPKYPEVDRTHSHNPVARLMKVFTCNQVCDILIVWIQC